MNIRHRNKNLLAGLFFLSCLILSIIFNSRAFAVGSLLAISSTLYPIINSRLRYRAAPLMLIAFLTGIMVLSFLYKVDSSLGRVFIYKISGHIFADSWQRGIGIGEFKNIYLLYQAKYFHSAQYTTKELLLADNTYYAFNDYWQWVIETGLVGIAVLILSFSGVAVLIIKHFKAIEPKLIAIFAVGSILILSSAALFTHVFEKPYFQLLFLVSLNILILEYVFRFYKKMILLSCSIAAICLIVIGSYVSRISEIRAYEKFNEVKDLHLYGYNRIASEKLSMLKDELQHDPVFLSTYAQACEFKGDYKKALLLYNELSRIHISNSVYMSIGNCYQRLGNPIAEEYYLNAIDMVPNRLRTRMTLFDYYLTIGENNKAIKTATALLAIPIKVPSQRAEFIRMIIRKKLVKIYN